MGDIKINPIADVSPPMKSKPKKRGILSVEESQRFFKMETIDNGMEQ